MAAPPTLNGQTARNRHSGAPLFAHVSSRHSLWVGVVFPGWVPFKNLALAVAECHGRRRRLHSWARQENDREYSDR